MGLLQSEYFVIILGECLGGTGEQLVNLALWSEKKLRFWNTLPPGLQLDSKLLVPPSYQHRDQYKYQFVKAALSGYASGFQSIRSTCIALIANMLEMSEEGKTNFCSQNVSFLDNSMHQAKSWSMIWNPYYCEEVVVVVSEIQKLTRL